MNYYPSLLFFLWILCICIISATVYYVDPSSSAGNGLSWQNSFNTLDMALLLATPLDEIWLMGGFKYTPSNPSDRTDCFISNIGIAILGGFSGTETVPEQRDSNFATSILSGDIGIIGENHDNCYHVITYKQSLTLDNVIIQHGNANYNGLYVETQIENTLHRYGGALITFNVAKPTLLVLNNVTIRNNSAMNGGALWVTSTAQNSVQVLIKDSIFEYNRAINGEFEGGYGGAIYEMHLAAVAIFNTSFKFNTAHNKGGGIYQDYGAMLYVDGCVFDQNSVDGFGGAVFSEDRNSQTDGTFPTFRRCIFRNNSAGVDGGAICWYNFVNGTLENNQFESNIAMNKGGAISFSVDTISASSGNIFSGNIANGDSNTNDIYNETRIVYTNIDDTISFNISRELNELFNISRELNDLYPFDASDSLCYVDIDNMNSNQNGNEWNSAYNHIQDCLDKLRYIGGEVWIKYGTYIPTTIPEWKQRIDKTSTMMQSFSMYDNIRMYGGFSGIESSRYQRNWKDYPTFLSCQISKNRQCFQILNAADNTIVDGFIFANAGIAGQNRRRMANSINIGAVLSSTSTFVGSGIYSNSTNITVVNSIFTRLFSSGKGGAVYCVGMEDVDGLVIKSPTFINVHFLGNRAVARGGAISADGKCNFICKSCKFDANSCAAKGGAVYLDFDCDPIFIDATFTRNYALESGSCIAADGKSFVRFNGTTLFSANHARMEGCLYSGSGVGPGIQQGFQFEQTPIFSSNYMDNTGIGHNDMYGWPFSILDIAATPPPTVPTIQIPTTSPTPAPVSTVPHTVPNVIVFIVDDMDFTQAWSESAPNGLELQGKTVSYDDFPTRYLDEFRKEAVIFPRSYAAAPKCTPSRFAILTGRLATRSEWGQSRTLLTSSGKLGTNVSVQVSKIWYHDSEYNIAYALKNNPNTSYYTAAVGKWHLMSSTDNGHEYGCDALSHSQNHVLYEQCTSAVKEQGFDFVDAWYVSNIAENSYYSHNPEWMVSQSQRFINQAVNVEHKPFFLYFAATLTHTPSVYDAIFNFTYRDTPKGTLNGSDIPTDTIMSPREAIWAKTLTHGFNIRRTNELLAAVYWLDESFGALIHYLKENNLYDNTFIVVQNDHGMPAKGLLYQHGTRIFQFVRYPPLFGDNGPYIMPNDFIVSNVDLAATIFELTDITIPNAYKLDGKSWLNDVRNQILTKNTATQTCCKYKHLDVYNSHSIVTGQYQYIYRANTHYIEHSNDVSTYYPNVYDEQQLYDLYSDPNQKNNQINNNTLSNTISFFQTLMRQYLTNVCPINTGCKMPNLSYTISPTKSPTNPTNNPTISPTPSPTDVPTLFGSPTKGPTLPPTPSPTLNPTNSPTPSPTINPTNSPTMFPSKSPSNFPSKQPTKNPTNYPSKKPTRSPLPLGITRNPSKSPTNNPSESPTNNPSLYPSINPSLYPTSYPTYNPSNIQLYPPIKRFYALTLLADFGAFQTYLDSKGVDIHLWASRTIRSVMSLDLDQSLVGVIVDVWSVTPGSIVIDYSLSVYNMGQLNQAITNMVNSTSGIGIKAEGNFTFPILSNQEITLSPTVYPTNNQLINSTFYATNNYNSEIEKAVNNNVIYICIAIVSFICISCCVVWSVYYIVNKKKKEKMEHQYELASAKKKGVVEMTDQNKARITLPSASTVNGSAGRISRFRPSAVASALDMDMDDPTTPLKTPPDNVDNSYVLTAINENKEYQERT